jgi:tetratricopeptide (TPR) repeat protein
MALLPAICLALLLLPAFSRPARPNDRGTTPPAEYVGNGACAACHASIAKSYAQTVMARASGPAAEGLVPGEFVHRQSGVHYRVYLEGGRAWLSFERPTEPKVAGKRELLYYIGSNRKGRTYLFSVNGFLFESPINWYSQEGRWNMAPGYTEAREIPMTLPAVMDCLNCHTSGARRPIAGTENRFAEKPFAHDGITCERCHGPGAAHASGRGPIINPAKLLPQRRDSICMECHFEGTVAIERRGRRVYEFRPGDNLFDYIRYFVLTGSRSQSPRALNQAEALALSVCKQKSGDRMSCTSCHDPHVEPSAANKASYYRGKCIACHGEAFAARHHSDKPDCAGCHMPSLPSKDVAHTQATDHRILRRPADTALPAMSRTQQLLAYPASASAKQDVRELALAWETLAQSNVEGASEQAERHLRQAISAQPNDPALLAAMAFLEQKHGRGERSRELYERALKLDPLSTDAATNLGVLEAREGQVRRAAELWQGAFLRAPYRSALGINLAILFCAAGQPEQAKDYVGRVLEFNPDFGPALRLFQSLQANPPRCKP